MLKFYVMKRTEVVNIRYAACDVYIGRAGRGEDGYFRNPFRLLPGMSRGATLDRYRSYFYGRLRTDPEFRQRIHALKGKRLGCFCKPYPCICAPIFRAYDLKDDFSERPEFRQLKEELRTGIRTWIDENGVPGYRSPARKEKPPVPYSEQPRYPKCNKRK